METENRNIFPELDTTAEKLQKITEQDNKNVVDNNATGEVKPGEDNSEITNNDGSVLETLDTVFHGQPGYIQDHSAAGSNRADYYEARSEGKSDVEEESNYLKKKNEEQ